MSVSRRRTLSLFLIVILTATCMQLALAGDSGAAQEWTRVGAGGLGDPASGTAASSVMYKGNLVIGTNAATGGKVCRYAGGKWTALSTPGFGDPDNISVISLAVYKGKLYAGTDNPFEAPFAQIWRYDDSGTSWTKVADSDSLPKEVSNWVVEINTLAAGGDWLFAGTTLRGNLGYVFAYNGSSWYLVCGGSVPGKGYISLIRSVLVKDRHIYIGMRLQDENGRRKPEVMRRDVESISTSAKPNEKEPRGALWEMMSYQGAGSTVTALSPGPNDSIFGSTEGAGNAGISVMKGFKTWQQLYSASADQVFIRTLSWDGGDRVLFSVYKERGAKMLPGEFLSMTTEGKNPEKIAADGFGDPDNTMIKSALWTYDTVGGVLNGGAAMNFYATVTNWSSGFEVWGTRVEPPYPKWYFAEGYTGSGFDEWITILNPDAARAANVIVEYMLNNEENPAPQTVAVPPASRYTIKVNDVIGPNHEVSIMVMCTNRVSIVVERPMYFRYSPDIQGGHVVVGARFPATNWYFAEGTSISNFHEYLTIQNPSEEQAEVTVSYYGREGDLGEVKLNVPGSSRSTVYVRDKVKEQDVSASVESTNGVPIVAERPVYFSGARNGGHCAVGVTSPVVEAYFGEGYTAAGWDEYLLIQNPNNEEITVNGDFLIKGKGKSPFVAKVKPNSRATYLVDSYVPEGSELGMALRCSRGFIAERAMYFDYSMRNSILTGGHDCFGGTYGNMFLFAEGYTGTTWDEYLTLANPNTEAISVRVQFMVEGAANPDPFDVEVAAGNRSTVRVKDHVGENTNVSTSLSSDSSFIAERPMYFIYENSVAGGDCVIGYTP